MPSPSPELQHPEYCYQSTTNNTKLAPVFGRPRATLGLLWGFALEGSYLPAVTVAEAHASLAGFALSRFQALPIGATHLALVIRAHATTGRIRGPITCPRSSLQLHDAGAPCFGSTPSLDTFHPTAFGTEAALGTMGAGGRIAGYVGGGVSWLRPRFQAGFLDAQGNDDRSAVIVDLVRGTAFAGATLRVSDVLALSAQIYDVPADVTVMRVGAEYRLR